MPPQVEKSQENVTEVEGREGNHLPLKWGN